MYGGSQALLQVVNQNGDREGVRAGLVAGACFGCHGLVLAGLLLMLQVLICALGKDTHNLAMHLQRHTTPAQAAHPGMAAMLLKLRVLI